MHLKHTFMNPQSNRRGSNEALVASDIGQVGTQLDAFTKLGIENVGPLITRGVLIDVATLTGVDMLPDTCDMSA